MSKQVTSQTLTHAPVQTAGLWTPALWSLNLGMGAFIGIGIGAAAAEVGVIWALTLAALVAISNCCSEVQVATPLPDAVERPFFPIWLQFTARLTQLIAQLTTAAVAALGLAGYLLSGLHQPPIWLVPIALLAVLLAVLLLTVPVRRSWNPQIGRWFAIITGLALFSLIGSGLPKLTQFSSSDWISSAALTPTNLAKLLQTTALMSVVYASYESLAPRPRVQSVPRTPVKGYAAVLGRWVFYISVATVGIATVGATVWGSSALAYVAPLTTVMQSSAWPSGAALIALAAVAVMTRILLLLLPKLADQLLDLHQLTATRAQPNGEFTAPLKTVGFLLGGLLLVSDVQTLWSFSAFAFLLHAALTHWMAIQSPPVRHCPRWLSGMGLGLCLFLSFWLEWHVWLMGLSLIALGLIWQGMIRWSDE